MNMLGESARHACGFRKIRPRIPQDVFKDFVIHARIPFGTMGQLNIPIFENMFEKSLDKRKVRSII